MERFQVENTLSIYGTNTSVLKTAQKKKTPDKTKKKITKKADKKK